MAQLHQIKPEIKLKRSKRVGRGGKRGSYSGKGLKGQKSRAGHRIRPQLRDVIKKIPKKRGYRFISVKKNPEIVKLEQIEKRFNNGDKITPKILFRAGLIKFEKGRLPKVKILGCGKTDKKFLISECLISQSVGKKVKIGK